MAEERGEIRGLSMAQRAALRTAEEIASRLEPDAYRRLTDSYGMWSCTMELRLNHLPHDTYFGGQDFL